MARVEKFYIHHIARVEGHGNLLVEVQEGEEPRVEMQITEGTRLFEAFLRGHTYDEASHIMSRICGICSHSHAVAALRGVEAAMGIEPSPTTVELRKLMLIGDMLESHALHINFLALPDYLGCDSIISMLPKYREEVERALRLKKLGNDLMELVGGRRTHPCCAVVGGFTHVPTRRQLEAMLKRLKESIPDAEAQISLMGGFKEPSLTRRSQYLAVKNPHEYPLHDGELVTLDGQRVPEGEYGSLIEERNILYSHAKFSEIGGKPFLVGALARLNVSSDQLSERARRMADEVGLKLPSFDTFHMNLGQALEYLHYLEQAIEIMDRLRERELKPEKAKFKVCGGSGAAAVEAPRGVLVHRYSIDASGRITGCDVITPTAMNYANIEADVRAMLPQIMELPREQALLRLNMLVRAYDPCISCSVHLIRLKK